MKNRLKYSLAYLSGAMDRVPDGGVEWRLAISKQLRKLGIGIFNPCDKPTDPPENHTVRETLQEFRNVEDFDSIKAVVKEIVGSDLRMIDKCDFVVLYIDIDIHMAGSYWEMCYAVQQKKPILTVCKQGKVNTPGWLFGVIPHEHMFGTFDEMLEYLNHIDKDDNIDAMKRWHFFDWDKIFYTPSEN